MYYTKIYLSSGRRILEFIFFSRGGEDTGLTLKLLTL